MKIYIFVILAILCSCSILPAQEPNNGQATQPTPVPQVDTNERYRIGYQDTLDIQVFRHPELNRRVNVSPNGTINLFRLDAPIMAVCKTEDELAKTLKPPIKRITSAIHE